MKQGKTLTQLAEELEREQQAKEDYAVDTRSLRSTTQDSITHLETTGQEVSGPVLDVPHEQIAERLNIPKKFYDRMRSQHPDVFDTTLNTLFEREPEERMLRTLDGNIRAFLSKRYRRIDNYEMLQCVLPILKEDKSLQVQSCEVTDRRMYLKCITPRIEGEIKKGDVVQSGIVIRNSEVGLGRMLVAPLIYTLSCENGMIAERYGKGKNHIGRAMEKEQEVEMLLSDEAKQADDDALMLKLRDIVKATMEQSTFDTILQDLREAREREVEHPQKAVERLCQKFNMVYASEPLTKKVYENSGMNGFTQYGLLNAVTEYAQEVDNYDRSTELEATGGKILTLSTDNWKEIATAS